MMCEGVDCTNTAVLGRIACERHTTYCFEINCDEKRGGPRRRYCNTHTTERRRQAQKLAKGVYKNGYKPKPCKRCSNVFVPETSNHVYCTDTCRFEFGTCANALCGRQFAKRYGDKQQYCSRNCRMVVTTTEGYVKGEPGEYQLRYFGRGHFMYEHRYVVEQAIGRPLSELETVHHINGIKDDNRPENLQLRSSQHGQGVVRMCLDCGSHNVVAVPLPEDAQVFSPLPGVTA